MEKLQWNQFVKKIYIKGTLNDIYKLWATKKGITRWFVKDANYISKNNLERKPEELVQKGDTYTWYWHNCDAIEQGTVIATNEKNSIEFSFANSKVAVKLETKNNATLVTLTQFEIPEDEKNKYQIFYGCSNGWTFWLTNLKSFVEHGILLNETELHFIDNDYSGYEFVNM